VESRRKSKSGSRSIKRIRTALVLFIIVGFFISSIHPTFAASYSYKWNKDTKTATIYIDTLFGKKPVLQIRQVSVKADLTTFTEVLEITPLVNYTLTSSDLKYLWKRYKGRYDISSFRLQRLVNEPYTIREPVYEAYNVSVPVYDATNTTIIAYQNETRKRIVGYHDVVKYRKTFKDFNPTGKSIEKGKTYTIKVVLHKKPELGDVRIHLSPQICGLKINELTWWNTSWQYRIKTTVSGIPPGGCQLILTVHSGSGTNNATDVFLNEHNATNFDDLRFTLDDTTELAYWIEDNTTDPVKVWVNVTGNGTVYLYYGNPSAPPASDGDATFEFFDDFEGTSLDTSKWNTYQEQSDGSYSVSDSKLKLDAYQVISNNYQMTDGIIESKLNIEKDEGTIFGRSTVNSGDGFSHSYASSIFTPQNHVCFYSGGSNVGCSDTGTLTNGVDLLSQLCLHGNNQSLKVFYYGNDTPDCTYDASRTDYASGYIGLRVDGTGSGDRVCYFDWILVRKYTDPEPTWSTWSSEEVTVEDVRPLLDYNSQRKLARTSDGYLHRVYTKWDGSSYRVYYGKSTDDGSTWTESVLTDAGVNSTHPTIAVDSEDNIWVVYEREGGGIKYRVYQGTSWGSEQTLSTDAGEAPALAVDASDNVHVVWMANLSGTYKVRYSYYDGADWNDTINITASTEDQKYPSIAIDPYSIHVVWQEYDTTNSSWNIKYRRYQSGWDEVFNITNQPHGHNTHPSIAVDLNNNAHIVWEDTSHEIKYRRYDYSTSSWGSIETVCDGGIYSQLKPSVSVYSTSNVYVVWYGKTSSSPDHWVIRGAYRTTSWSSVSDLVSVTGINITSPSTIFARYPQMCSNCYTNIPDSDVAFVYEQDGEIKYDGASWRCTDKYTITFIAKDANTGQVVSNFTVEFSTGETKTTDNGAVKFRCLESGYYQATVTATGYYPSQNSIVLDQSKELIVYLTPITGTTYVLPKSHLVEFIVEDFTGSPIEGVNVTAVAVETTMGEGWLSSIFGFENETEIENTTMNGTTDSGGRISFLMVETLKYRLTFTKPTAGINKTLYIYPKEEQYVIILPPGETPDISDCITWNLSVVEINSSYSSLNLTYTDLLNKTSSLRFFVLDENQTEIYNQTFSYQTTINASYIVEKQAGKSYFWGFNAMHNEFGEIQATKVMRFRGRLIDLGIENESYYSWIAISLLIFVSLLFSGITAKFGYFTVPGMAMFFWWIGWLSVRLSIVLTALIMGVLLYLGKREREEGI